jgi:hypothetical protein
MDGVYLTWLISALAVGVFLNALLQATLGEVDVNWIC